MSISASRWPIEEEMTRQFVSANKNTWSGYFVPKGINHARIKKTSGGAEKIYHIFNTQFAVSLMLETIVRNLNNYMRFINHYVS